MNSTPFAALRAALRPRGRRRAQGPRAAKTAPQGLDPDGRALAALTALPEAVRDAFILARFEEWPYSRIAAHLGMTAPAAEEAIAQALHALLRAQEIGDPYACGECVAQTVRAALAEYAALRAE